MDTNERESYLREHIVEIAEESFPDDVGLVWNICGFEHKGKKTTVEVEPEPSTAGYPRFRFEMSFEATGKPAMLACHCLDNNKWELLFTA